MKCLVYRTVTVKTKDVIESDKTLDEFEKWLEEE